ncbi:hypothetical protein B0T14DRAFT_498073 [Immersiella caudata]|uniref:Uncharacterized protein n=1 Tax=Immersiella caudata TaxID=314043 RepID=A0AA39WKG0_9PEZI|nr:hypothetical protein B0T14DRAFT_498073 [Immersiella caudata]
MTDAVEPASPTPDHEEKYDTIQKQLRELDREARKACYQLLVLLVQSRDKAAHLSEEWDRIPCRLTARDRREASSLLLGSGGFFGHEDNLDFTLGFSYNNAGDVFNVSVDFDAELGSSCYRQCPQKSKPFPRKMSRSSTPSPSPTGATAPDTLRSVAAAVDHQPQAFSIHEPNSASAAHGGGDEGPDHGGPFAPQTPDQSKPSSRTIDTSPRSSPLSSPASNCGHNDPDTPFAPPSPSFSPEPAKTKRRSRAPTGQRKRRRVTDDDMDDQGPTCRKCDPPRTITDKTHFKRHMRLEHGPDQGKAYLCPLKDESDSVCNKAIRHINNVRRHLGKYHKMAPADYNKLVHELEMVPVEGL